ncbi:MAG: cytochrome C oxidase subunit IV family protein, partial [Ignavibacteria bacterium]|nr:cytochrome C oxidase subunit IV family protein [Ignavibacteria bacterium]
TYIIVWLGLVSLTAITVAVAGIDLKKLTLITALTIASIKSLLVLTIFMHLKFEDKTFRIFVSIAFLTLIIFLVLTFTDYSNM